MFFSVSSHRYKVKLHLIEEGDPLGANDRDGWMIASMGPSAQDIQLNPDAEALGWKVCPVMDGKNPALHPPWVPLPEGAATLSSPTTATTAAAAAAAGEEAKPTQSSGQAAAVAADGPVAAEEKVDGDEKAKKEDVGEARKEEESK